MSFASEMKNELTRIEVDDLNAKAELSALIRMNGALSLSNQQFVINVQTENAATARRIYSLIKRVFDVEVEILVRKKMKLKKNNIYLSDKSAGKRNIRCSWNIEKWDLYL